MERDDLEDLAVDTKIISACILRKETVRIWSNTGLSLIW
jgi:hypothetical protein